MELLPKFGRVLVKREIKKQTSSGIFIPESAAKRNAPCEGVIVSLGETAGYIEDPSNNMQPTRIFNVGDNVLFGRHSGAWLDATEGNDDGTLFICQDADILAVMRKND